MNDYNVELTVFGHIIKTTVKAKCARYAREKVNRMCSMKLERVVQPYENATTLEEFKAGVKEAAAIINN
jgi:hypothetical protein